ncbi:hypothetical protein GCM10010286_14850 [Streptomyces toxytricini]|nr:hypothetical protein GCM10010286_14850 [Streptomyces toxytricini]
MSSRVTPASSAAWIVATDSPRSASPYSADIPMQPSPSGKTAGPVEPRDRTGRPEASAEAAAATAAVFTALVAVPALVVVVEVLWFVVMHTKMT